MLNFYVRKEFLMKMTAGQRRAVRRAEKTIKSIDFAALQGRVCDKLRRRDGVHSSLWIILDVFAPKARKPRNLF